MSNASIRVVARFIVKPDKVEAAKTLFTALIDPTRAENGCTSYQLLQNVADPADFAFVEEWTSAAALDAHGKSPHVTEARGKFGDLFGAAPDIRRYTLVK